MDWKTILETLATSISGPYSVTFTQGVRKTSYVTSKKIDDTGHLKRRIRDAGQNNSVSSQSGVVRTGIPMRRMQSDKCASR